LTEESAKFIFPVRRGWETPRSDCDEDSSQSPYVSPFPSTVSWIRKTVKSFKTAWKRQRQPDERTGETGGRIYDDIGRV